MYGSIFNYCFCPPHIWAPIWVFLEVPLTLEVDCFPASLAARSWAHRSVTQLSQHRFWIRYLSYKERGEDGGESSLAKASILGEGGRHGLKRHPELIVDGICVPNRLTPWHDCICGVLCCLSHSSSCPSLAFQPSTIRLDTDWLQSFPFPFTSARVSFYCLQTRSLTDILNLKMETKTWMAFYTRDDE